MNAAVRGSCTSIRCWSCRRIGHVFAGVILATGLSCCARPAYAISIDSLALGSDMAGGFVTVTFFGGPMDTAPIVAMGTAGVATSPGSFSFSVTGDTNTATWSLTNFGGIGSAPRSITSVVIDLTTSNSLFDDDSAPSTPDSLSGVKDVVYVSGPPIAGSGEITLWLNALNTGDLYRAEFVSWGGFMIPALTPGATAEWMDDTDKIVPEPSSALLCLVGLMLLALKTCRFARR